MKIKKQKKQNTLEHGVCKDFMDMVAPSTINFFTDYFICGNTYRLVWAVREYPTSTTEQAILRYIGEKDGVNLKIYARQLTGAEEKNVIHNATNKNRMNTSTDNVQENIEAQNNLEDVATLVSTMHRNREPLMHCAVYIEIIADTKEQLGILQTEVLTELIRSKINVDRLLLRQQEGFMAASPVGYNVFGSQFERVLPASSVANLYPLNYSGKTNSQGFSLGKDKFGSNIIVDFNQRDEDKTNANILILGNSGQGKSYLLKLILCNILESGKNVICLDPEHEYVDLAENLEGCFVDLMSGQHIINPLEVKSWDNVEGGKSTKLSQHISFLKDFFRSYKDFCDQQIDTIEILLAKLYGKWRITNTTNFQNLKTTDYPILSDLYDLAEMEHQYYDENSLYTKEMLQEILLGLHSICQGSESKFFNGHTNITSDRFIVFGVKGLLQANKNLKNAMLFNVLSFMSDKLLTEGNTVASIDEFYLFLSNLTAIEYVRNFMKRVRKKESAVILSSQNLEDFNLPEIKELTKPLFSIPTHTFLFNAGNIDKQFYMETLQLEESEYKLIQYPERGVCLFKCGNERYNLKVIAPKYKETLFGIAGGR